MLHLIGNKLFVFVITRSSCSVAEPKLFGEAGALISSVVVENLNKITIIKNVLPFLCSNSILHADPDPQPWKRNTSTFKPQCYEECLFLSGRENGMSDLVAARKFLDTADRLGDPLTFYNVFTWVHHPSLNL